jgi:hypothetical protein
LHERRNTSITPEVDENKGSQNKMRVHPEILMKTKTIVGTCQRAGCQDRQCGNVVGQPLANPTSKNMNIKVHPAMLMKTMGEENCERRNSTAARVAVPAPRTLGGNGK